jgi:hypothetical protein
VLRCYPEHPDLPLEMLAGPLPDYRFDVLADQAGLHFDGFKFPANQRKASDFIGPVGAISLRTCWHLVHSNVRRSWPDGPDMIWARLMRVWHRGQRGRSMEERDRLLE